jgi:hypothetical protein
MDSRLSVPTTSEKVLFVDSNNLVLANMRFSQITMGFLFLLSIFTFFLSASERQLNGMAVSLLGTIVLYFWFLNLREKWSTLHGPQVRLTTSAAYLPTQEKPINWEQISKITLESILVGSITRISPRNSYKIHITTKYGMTLSAPLHSIAFDRLSLQRIAKKIQPTAVQYGIAVEIVSEYKMI